MTIQPTSAALLRRCAAARARLGYRVLGGRFAVLVAAGEGLPGDGLAGGWGIGELSALVLAGGQAGFAGGLPVRWRSVAVFEQALRGAMIWKGRPTGWNGWLGGRGGGAGSLVTGLACGLCGGEIEGYECAAGEVTLAELIAAHPLCWRWGSDGGGRWSGDRP